MQKLLDSVIQPAFNNPVLNQKHDSAVVNFEGANLAFTTDSYVVKPLFFPGGDIGKLAVCGTLNDLAMSGAKPLYMSCSLIIEEGFPIKDLERIGGKRSIKLRELLHGGNERFNDKDQAGNF